eukprot:g19570.t1
MQHSLKRRKKSQHEKKTILYQAQIHQVVKETSPAWQWWASLGSPRHILSPMVGQSELSFRLLCRRHGATLCYTPMFISSTFASDPAYRQKVWQTSREDRPLIAQFCGNDPQTLLKAARFAEHHVDAVDLNLGCPQEVARRGHYGAFLMDKDWKVIRDCVSTLAAGLSVPVSCKIRVFADPNKTIRYAEMLVAAGASLLTIHPRQRHEKEEVHADWHQLALVKKAISSVPIIGNGDVWSAEDAWLMQKQTAVDGVMSAQGLLHNPALFEPLCKLKLDKGPQPEHFLSHPPPDVSLPVPLSLPSHMRCRRELPAFLTFRLSSFLPSRTSTIGQTQTPGEKGSTAKKSTVVDASELALPGTTPGAAAWISSPEDLKQRFALAHEYLDLCFTSCSSSSSSSQPAAEEEEEEEQSQHSNGAPPAMPGAVLDPAVTPCHPSVIRRHIFFMLVDAFQANADLLDALGQAGGQGKPLQVDAQGNSYFTDLSAQPYRSILQALRQRAERGAPHPAAVAAGRALQANGKPRPRRRDGSLAPPPWPVGGGGFHVAADSSSSLPTALLSPAMHSLPGVAKRKAVAGGAGGGGVAKKQAVASAGGGGGGGTARLSKAARKKLKKQHQQQHQNSSQANK